MRFRRPCAGILSLIFFLFSALSVAPTELFAAPVIDAPECSPRTLPSGVTTQAVATLKITLSPGDPPVVAGGVYLYRLDPVTKKYLGTLGTMRDDGQNGDAAANDNIFSLRFNINPGAASAVLLQGSVPFKGVVRRSLSKVTAVEVSSTNKPPVFTSNPELTIPHGVDYTYPAKAEDPEGGPVIVELVSGPQGAAFFEGLLRWQPEFDQIGDHVVTLRAKDSQNASSLQTFTLKVIELNLSPLITSIPETFAETAEKYIYDCNAFDPEGKQVTFTFASAPPQGVVMNQITGLMEWTPGSGNIGSHEIKITAADHLGSTDEQTFLLQVYDRNAVLNLISPAGEHNVRVGETLTLPFQSNLDKTVFSANPVPDNAEINPVNFIFTPTVDQAGDHIIAFRAKAAGQEVSNVVTLHVLKDEAGNQAPVFLPIQEQTVAEGDQLAFIVNATDGDGDPLKFSAPGLNLDNAFFNQVTQQFNFSPSFDQSGGYDILFEVTDGTASVQTSVHIVVQNVEPAVTELRLVVDKTPNPTFRTGLPLTGNVTGQPAAPASPESPKLITGLSPSQAQAGDELDVTLAAINASLTQETTTASFGDGITVKNLEILTPLTAKAHIVIDKEAAVGIRAVEVTHNGELIPSIVAFDVLKAVATIKGKVLDEFTLEPIGNAKVGVNGSIAFALTNPQGEFLINNVPSGDLTLIATKQNYTVGKISVTLGAGQDFEITDPIALRALARAPNLGGVLPPAPTVASVIDRGVSKKGGGLTLEQAKAVVSDTMIAVGGIEAGVLDEAGNQLNPKMNGSGNFSLTQQGVEFQALSLLRGDVVTLKEFFDVLTGAFNFPHHPKLQEVVDGFQKQVDEAWANPGDPANAMPIILFNEGTALSPAAPIVSPDTRFNRFQIFLLIQSFIAFNSAALDRSINNILSASGVDFESQIPEPKFPPVPGSSNPPEGFATSGNFLIPDAEAAQVQTSRCADESFSCYVADLQKKKTFSKVWRAIGANMIAEASKAALFAAGLTFAMQSAISFAMGASGGRYGAAIALINLSTAAFSGFQSVLMFKIVMGWFIALTVASLEPPPVSGGEPSIDADGNFVIPFDLSPEHVRAEGNPQTGQIKKHFRYHLYRVPNCNSPIDASSAEHVALKAEPDYKNPSNRNRPFLGPHQFTVPRSMLRAGENHFRIRSIQYIQNREKEIVEGIEPLDLNNDGVMNLNEFQKAGLGDEIDYRVADFNNDGNVDANEYVSLQNRKITAEYEIAPNTPRTPEIRALMGQLNFLPGSEPGKYQFERAAREAELQQRAAGRIDPNSKGFHARTNIVDFFADSPFVRGNAEFLPEIEDFSNNAKAFVAADDVILSTNTSGKQAIYDGDESVAKQIADDVYQKHFGQAPTEQQEANVRNMVTAQRLKSIAGTQIDFSNTAIDNVNQVIDDIKTGRMTQGKINLVVPTYPSADSLDAKPIFFSATLTPDNVDEILNELGDNTFKPGSPKTEAFISSIRANKRIFDAGKLVQDAQEPVLRDTLKLQGGFTDQEIDQKFGNFLPKQSGVGIKGQAHARMAMAEEVELKQLIQDMKKRQVGPLTIQEPELDPRSGAIVKGVGAYSNFAGQIIGASSTFITFIQSAQVLMGDFSEACFSTPGPAVPTPSEQFPPTFEPYPGNDEPSAIIRELRSGPKQGFLQREYPGEDAQIASLDAGFPPGFVSSDRHGNAYAINMASTEKFGGRIFKYDLKRTDAGANGLQGITADRELVGAVNYFSLEIQVSRPAFPVGMTVGPLFDAADQAGNPVKTQDLFVANLDLVDGVNRILKVPISLIDTNPAAYPVGGIPVMGKNPDTGHEFVKFYYATRHRIVGIPMAESEEFRFTGPTDMEVGPDPNSLPPATNANSSILFSDENNIFAMKKKPDGSYELVKVISLVGRRWSGLAFDKLGKFYFADYAGGDIFVMEWSKLQSIIQNGAFIINENMLKENAYRIAAGIDRPGDLELEGLSTHPGGVLHISTFKGIIPLTLPIIGKIGSAQDIKVTLFGVEQAVAVDADRGVFLATPSRENLEALQASVRYRVRDANGRDAWKESYVLLAEHGATILQGELA